jgi:DNA-binding MarR family transcriptional regulator
MDVSKNRVIRRKILLTLYEAYQTHPHTMLSPREVMDAAAVTHDGLLRNVFYLEERGFVECLKGFGTTLFGAAKLTAEGVDVVEDAQTLNELFPAEDAAPTGPADELTELFERIRIAALRAPLGQDDIDSLIEELEYLKRSLSRKTTPERMTKIETVLGWISASFDGDESVLQDITRLTELIRHE